MTTRASLILAVAAATLLLAGCGGTPVSPVDAAAPSTVPGDVTAPTLAATAPAAPVTGLLPSRADREAEIDADDQRGDGTQVIIDEVELTVAGHVAVYDEVGTLLGAVAVAAGESRNVAVPLDPALAAGQHRLRAVLHVDDGDGAFDVTRDAPARDDDDDDPAEIEDDRFTVTVG